MAWIKVRTDLADDPAVISMSAALNIDRFGIVGRLHSIWAWATDQLADGNAPGVTGSFLDSRVCTPGFAEQMARVGWLVIREDGMSFPKWDVHLSSGAKQRMTTAQRVKEHRRNALSVTEALPEKRQTERREEKTQTDREAGNLSVDSSMSLPDWLTARRVNEPWKSKFISAGMTVSTAEEIWSGVQGAAKPSGAFVSAAKVRFGFTRGGSISAELRAHAADLDRKRKQVQEGAA